MSADHPVPFAVPFKLDDVVGLAAEGDSCMLR